MPMYKTVSAVFVREGYVDARIDGKLCTFYNWEFADHKMPVPAYGELFVIKRASDGAAWYVHGPAPAPVSAPSEQKEPEEANQVSITVDGRTLFVPVGAMVRADPDGTIHIYTKGDIE